MDLVVDANVLFSALIKDSYIRHLLLLTKHSFYVPEFIFDEISKHINIILRKTELSIEETNWLLNQIILKANIKILSFEEFKDYAEEAEKISPDSDDVHYFALALKLNCPIWSNDKNLKKQNRIKILNTIEILELSRK